MNTLWLRTAFILSACLFLAGCAAGSIDDPITQLPNAGPETHYGLDLESLTPPKRKINLAVYNIVDKTGQRKANDTVSLASTAVTQGADNILVDILSRTGRGSWFRVMERNSIRNLLQERKIAELNRKRVHEYSIGRKTTRLRKKLNWANRRIAHQAVQELDEREKARVRQALANLKGLIREAEHKRNGALQVIKNASKDEKRRQNEYDHLRQKQLMEIAKIRGIDVQGIMDINNQQKNLELAKSIAKKLAKTLKNETSRRSNIAAVIRKAKEKNRLEMASKSLPLDQASLIKDKKYQKALKKAEGDEQRRQQRFDAFYKNKLKKVAQLRKNSSKAILMANKKKLSESQARKISILQAKLEAANRSEMARRSRAKSDFLKAKNSANTRRLTAERQLKNLRLKEEREQLKALSLEDVVVAKEVRRGLKAKLELLKLEKPRMLNPMIVADYLIEGAIVGFDTNEKTEGFGARFIAIGGDKKYRQDIVTVALRLVDVKTGEILLASTSTKTVYSIALQGGTYKFLDFNKLLEIEAGITRNEPSTLAVRQALEYSMMDIIQKGLRRGLWKSRYSPKS